MAHAGAEVMDPATALTRLVPLVHGRAASLSAERPVLVLLDGRSGSGKSTLARLLSRSLREAGDSVTVLHLDNVYPGWDGLAAASRRLGNDLLPRLREGRAAVYPSWSWVRDRPGPDVTVHPADVVLVEGVGAGSRTARAAGDLLVWLEATTAVRQERAMARDGDAYAPHWQRWAAQEQTYLAAEDPSAAADVVVLTSAREPSWSARRGGTASSDGGCDP